MKPTNSAKRMPSTGNKPGDTALKARAHSSVSASLVTTKYTPPAMRKVATKTIKAIHDTGRLSNQSATIALSCLRSGFQRHYKVAAAMNANEIPHVCSRYFDNGGRPKVAAIALADGTA